MHIETERKFLVRTLDFKKTALSSRHLVQGYVAHEGGRSVRVRISDDKAFLTIKGPGDAKGMSRLEWEKEIPVDDARDLMTLCLSGIIDKRRYIVPCGSTGRVFEVDEFYGDNEGLIVAEIELGGEDEEFPHPDWLGKEVTGDKRYYNASLSRHPFKDWQ
jgi:CYTH domain-containing protein